MSSKSPSVAIALALALTLPAPVLAGAYGNSAVSADRVGQTASAGSTVYCPRVGAEVPQRLAAQMDCGTATATPRVLSNRVTNNGGFFARFRHQPGAGIPEPDSDSDNRPTAPRVVVTTDTGTPSTPTPVPTPSAPTPTPTAGPTDDTPTPTSGAQSKYDRLSELGVTSEENYREQSESFRNQVNDYRREVGTGGDWSGFNPTSE